MHALALYTAGIVSLAQAATDEAELKRVLFPFYGREAARYEFFVDEEQKQRLELKKEPVLTWTNAENYMGAVFIWTKKGRPEMIGCIGSHQIRPGKSVVFHEFHSLSLQPLQPVKFGGRGRWESAKPGVEMAAVEGAARPSDSERLRLTQMRNIAREFRGWMKDNDDVTELRLLPQPIVRYKAPALGVVDGAIFALVWKGTDPEVLLILEDRKEEKEARERWQYALARFNFRDMWVKRGDKEIWRVGVSSRSDIYITAVVGETTWEEMRAGAKAEAGDAARKK